MDIDPPPPFVLGLTPPLIVDAAEPVGLFVVALKSDCHSAAWEGNQKKEPTTTKENFLKEVFLDLSRTFGMLQNNMYKLFQASSL